jgi:hypothetical protein
VNKIVRERYPIAKLPADLREGMDADLTATVVVTINETNRIADAEATTKPMTLDEIFALRRPPYRTKEEIDADIRRQRDEWDD